MVKERAYNTFESVEELKEYYGLNETKSETQAIDEKKKPIAGLPVWEHGVLASGPPRQP